MMHRRAFVLGTLSASVSASACWAAPISGTDIRALLQQIDPARMATAIVTGLLDARGRHLVSFGHIDAPDSPAPDGDTVFEVGSLTKIFTAILLADMIARGEMRLDDPIGIYLPLVHVPTFEGRAITLKDIATYAPGLPGWPSNMPPLDPTKPFPDYTVAQLYAALENEKLKYAPGTHYVYSNFGYGLLGQILSLRAGMSFEELVVDRICKPLEMNSTRSTLTPDMRARLAPGHGAMLQRAEIWSLPPALAGAGAFASTANDLLTLLEICMGRRRTSLTPALETMLDMRRPADQTNVSAAFGWFISNGHGEALVWKDGATAGFSAFIGYSMQDKIGVVMLANGQCSDRLTPLGKHLLASDFPLPKNLR